MLHRRLHIDDTRENHDRDTRRTNAANRVARCTVVVRHAAGACRRRGEIGESQGTLLAQQSLRRSGMRNAGKNDGEQIDEAIR
ncbi:hypothetical protein [Burkholderia ubonensis]|uniref:hypothetical protein n=1 Tax=Burkholderia ubonensis TaxID=101571 RepID=UPI000AE25ABC|nr:hypothetical protein [Burkholderia ubonensis]